MKKTKGVCGVGFKDPNTDVLMGGKIDPAYRCWANMLNRCYGRPINGYEGCEVYEGWKKYEVFRDWYYDNYKDGCDLDKDILGSGLLYSPDTCCFVPKSINNFLVKARLPRGRRVVQSEGVFYYAGISNPITKVREDLGKFKKQEDAQGAWLRRKCEICKELLEVSDCGHLVGKVLEKLGNLK